MISDTPSSADIVYITFTHAFDCLKGDPKLLESSGAPIRNLLKDLVFVQGAARGVGLRTPVTDVASASYQAAVDAGLSEADLAILYNTL